MSNRRDFLKAASLASIFGITATTEASMPKPDLPIVLDLPQYDESKDARMVNFRNKPLRDQLRIIADDRWMNSIEQLQTLYNSSVPVLERCYYDYGNLLCVIQRVYQGQGTPEEVLAVQALDSMANAWESLSSVIRDIVTTSTKYLIRTRYDFPVVNAVGDDPATEIYYCMSKPLMIDYSLYDRCGWTLICDELCSLQDQVMYNIDSKVSEVKYPIFVDGQFKASHSTISLGHPPHLACMSAIKETNFHLTVTLLIQNHE